MCNNTRVDEKGLGTVFIMGSTELHTDCVWKSEYGKIRKKTLYSKPSVGVVEILHLQKEWKMSAEELDKKKFAPDDILDVTCRLF